MATRTLNHNDMLREAKVFNRVVNCDHRAWHIEADPRHAELIMEHIGVHKGIVSTPGVDGQAEDDVESDTFVWRRH